MNLGAFSVSLAVKDLQASKEFYEKLGFREFHGDASQNWLILKNGDHVIGLFQGMFEKIMPKSSTSRDLSVAEAREVLFEQECERTRDPWLKLADRMATFSWTCADASDDSSSQSGGDSVVEELCERGSGRACLEREHREITHC